MAASDLSLFVNRFIEILRTDADIDLDRVLDEFDQHRARLETFYEKYRDDDSEGSDPEVSAMAQRSCVLYFGALENLEKYLEDGDVGLLTKAIEYTDEAGDILDQVQSWALEEMVDG